MQAMKLEKDNAVDRAEQAEQQARDANLRAEKSEEEVRGLQKKIQLIENELDQVQEQLSAANVKLEEKEKTLQNVSFHSPIWIYHHAYFSFLGEFQFLLIIIFCQIYHSLTSIFSPNKQLQL